MPSALSRKGRGLLWLEPLSAESKSNASLKGVPVAAKWYA